MGTATITLPNGVVADIDFDDALTDAELQAEIDAMYQAGAFRDPDLPTVDNTAPVDAPQPSGDTRPQGFLEKADAMIPDAVSEFASAANRAAMQGVDFLTTDPINNVLSLAGSEKRVPTLTQQIDKIGGQGGFMEDGTARDIVRAAGATVPAAGSLAPVQRQVGSIINTGLDLLGAGSSQLTAPVRQAAPYAQELYDKTMQAMPRRGVSEARRRAAEGPIKRREGSASTFGLDVDPKTYDIIRDPRQGKAAKQGLREGVVTMVRDATPAAREKMRRMVDIVSRSLDSEEFRAMNRPGDVVGESIASRARVLVDANRSAGSQVDRAAKALKGQPVDVQPAMQQFMADLEGMGIAFDPNRGLLSLDGSDIEGLAGPTNAITRLIKRLYSTRAPDAYDVHRMKKFIDETVTYGKGAEGLSGKTVNVMKALRHNLDATLDSAFPGYDKANTLFSRTRQALDTLQDAAGKRIDLTGENAETALGTLSRRVLGNAVTRQQLLKGLDEVDRTAKWVLGQQPGTDLAVKGAAAPRTVRPGLTADDLDDDLIKQIAFVSNLEDVFGSNASNSFLGELGKAADRSADNAAMSGNSNWMGEFARAGLNRARGISDENAIKAFKQLLEDR